MEIINRKEAGLKGLKQYFNGEQCDRGHISERYVKNGSCIECCRERHRKNREFYNKRSREYALKKKIGTLTRSEESITPGFVGFISIEKAKKNGLKRYFTGRPCKHGHRAERLVSSRACVVCTRLLHRRPWNYNKIERDIDVTGKRSGKLVAIKKSYQDKRKNWVWECLCDCGKTTYITACNINKGGRKSCGCLKGGRKREKLVGLKFGKLFVVAPSKERILINGRYYRGLDCICDCGKEVKVTTGYLKGKKTKTKSCGCAIKEDHKNKRLKENGGLDLPKEAYKLPKKERYRKYLTDCYVKGRIKEQCKIDNITQEMIEFKREQMILSKLIKEAKDGLNR